MVFPESLAAELQNNGYPLPKNTPVMWPGIALTPNNGSPTAFGAKSFLSDGVTLDPTAGTTSIFYSADLYMLSAYLNYVLPNNDPERFRHLIPRSRLHRTLVRAGQRSLQGFPRHDGHHARPDTHETQSFGNL
jgi:hypothetical protein